MSKKLKEALPIDALEGGPHVKGTTGQKKEVKQMLNQMYGFEAKINVSQQATIENVMKDKAKVRKYEQEINKMTKEYDQFREKDRSVLDGVGLTSFNILIENKRRDRFFNFTNQ